MAKAAYLRAYMPADRVGYYPEHDPCSASTRVLTGESFGVWSEEPRDDAFITEYRGRRYVCPRLPRLRMLEGLIAFRNTYPGLTASLLVPERVAEAAVRELRHIQASGPVRSHILTSPWHAPLRWFAAFDAGEREIVDRGDDGLSIRYRTLQGDAVRRLRRVVSVLEEVGFDDEVLDQLVDVISWLEGFPADALVELDYDDVAVLFPEGELVLDETASDLAGCVAALESGDLDRAGDCYAVAASRWARVQAIVHSN
jgi:hypothetical protein